MPWGRDRLFKGKEGVLVFATAGGGRVSGYSSPGTSDSSSLGGALTPAEKLMKEWLSPEPPDARSGHYNITFQRVYPDNPQ
jgi:hypothetical protein